ncbi:MAG: hypothetical protein PF542_05395 [Nanoarchaeota archaeon]|nr:hypothetical protein [Nanoarchaeota archaeon]
MTKKNQMTFETCLYGAKESIVNSGLLYPGFIGDAMSIIQTKELALSFLTGLIEFMLVKDKYTLFALSSGLGIEKLELHLKQELKTYMRRIILVPLKANRSGLPDV